MKRCNSKLQFAARVRLGPRDEQPADDLQRFFNEPRLPRSTCPLYWWKENNKRFKSLAELGKVYLSVPATSVPSERVFSAAGLTVNRLRSSLSPEHVNMLVTMHCNSDMV